MRGRVKDLSKRWSLNMRENGEEGGENTSKEAPFQSLFYIELMLSCVMKGSQTQRCDGAGGYGVG